jgi:hypothetical protein
MREMYIKPRLEVIVAGDFDINLGSSRVPYDSSTDVGTDPAIDLTDGFE